MNTLLKEQIGVSEAPHEKLNRFSDELREKAVDMAQELEVLKPELRVSVDGHNFGVIQECYYDMTLKDFVEAYEDKVHQDRLLAYLKARYDGYDGVPYCNIEDETKLDQLQINNYLSMELGLSQQQLTASRKELFVPFSLVAEMISWSDDV